MLKNGKKYVDKLLTDLSKAFYCLDYELLTAKLNADNFNLCSITFRTVMSNRKQRIKIENTYSTWAEIYLNFHRAEY